MPQQYKTHLSRTEQNLLADVKKIYRLCGTFGQIDSFVVWEDRIVIAFSVNGQRYFLKQWPRHIESEQEAGFVLTIQEYARGRGVPIPNILKTVNGNHILNWHDRRFSLQTFVGTSYEPRLRSTQILSCAHTLGRFHRVMENAQIGDKSWRDDPFFYAMHFIQLAKERVPQHQLSATSKKRVADLLNELCDLLEEVKQRLLDLGWLDLPQSPIHGDYCHFNCRFDEGQVVGVVDWDNAHLGPRLLDIAHAVNIGLGWSGSINYYEDFLWRNSVLPNHQELMNWFSEYSRTAPLLSEEEIQLIPLVCAALWPAPSSGFEPKCEVEIPKCEAVVRYMQYFLNEAENISKNLRVAL